MDARWCAHYHLAHSHGFQNFDVGTGRGGQGRNHDRDPLVGITHIFHETFHLKPWVGQIDVRGLAIKVLEILVARARNDVELIAGAELWPHFFQEPFQTQQVGQVPERSDEQHAPRLRLTLHRSEPGAIHTVGQNRHAPRTLRGLRIPV